MKPETEPYFKTTYNRYLLALCAVLILGFGFLFVEQQHRYAEQVKTIEQEEAVRSLYAAQTQLEKNFLLYLTETNKVTRAEVQARLSGLKEEIKKYKQTIVQDDNSAASIERVRHAAAALEQYISGLDENSAHPKIVVNKGSIETLVNHLNDLQVDNLGLFRTDVFAKKMQQLSAHYYQHLLINIAFLIVSILAAFYVFRLSSKQHALLENVDFKEELLTKQILDTLSEPTAVLHTDGRVLLLNKAYIRLYGLSDKQAGEIIGQKWFDMFTTSQKAYLNNKALPALNEKGRWQSEMYITTLSGETKSVTIHLARLSKGISVCTLHDNTENKKAEEKLHHVRQQYYQAQKLESLGRLAGGIAHDFNNVLSSISGYTEFLLQDLRRGTDEYNFAQKIFQGTHQAKQLVERLLGFSRTSAQSMAKVDLIAAVNENVSLLKAGFSEKIQIETQFSGAQFFVQANATQLSQIMMNLGVNAYDASDKADGKIIFSLKKVSGKNILFQGEEQMLPEKAGVSEQQEVQLIRAVDEVRTRAILGKVSMQTDYAVLEVKDTGTGIPFSVVNQMFEPFFTTKEIGKGTGLGLATVYGLVMDHKGLLVVDTSLKIGSSFAVYIPLDTDIRNEALQETQKPTSFLVIENEDDIEDDTSNTILVVDDQAEVRGIICSMLLRAKFKVVDSASAQEALEIIRENSEDIKLIITDYSMPGMNGVELAEEVALIKPSVPVILISGYAEKETQEKIVSVPSIIDFIRKPVQYEVLISKARAALDKAQLHA